MMRVSNTAVVCSMSVACTTPHVGHSQCTLYGFCVDKYLTFTFLFVSPAGYVESAHIVQEHDPTPLCSLCVVKL